MAGCTSCCARRAARRQRRGAELIIAHLVWAVFFFTFVSNAMMTGARSLLSGRN
jgi:hypothetical protein